MSKEKAFNYFKDYLTQRGFRLTKQRVAIVEMFLMKEGHLCIDELYYKLRKKYPRIGYTTVYRTFKLLKSASLVSEVNFSGKRKRFEHAFGRPHHDHLICEKCGRVIEFVDSEIEERQDIICKKYGFKGEKHLMEIFGKCRKCQGKVK